MALHRDIYWVGRQWAVTGYGLQLIDQRLKGVFDIEVDRLWDQSVLDTMRARGWLKAEWGVSEANQRAKFYRLTPEGKKQLLREESRWSELVNAIARVMTPVAAPGTDE